MKIRGFEKISFEQYLKDMKKLLGESIDEAEINRIYNDISLPKRATKKSAGYDFFSPMNFSLLPNKEIKIPTGIKSYLQDNEELTLHVRSSTGFKFIVNLLNAVGHIDSDYYNNEDNEGHIWLGFKNYGDKEWKVSEGDAFAQGIFINFLIADDDTPVLDIRKGGIGSTNK